MIVRLTNDGLGINTDYRALLKDFSDLYAKVDLVKLESIFNKNLNETFWNKLIDNWLNNHSIEKVNEAIRANTIPNFNEKLDIDWLNLAQRDYNYQWRLHSFDFLPPLLSAYKQTKDTKYLSIFMNLLIKWEKNFIREQHLEEIFAWNDHSTANRLLNLTYCLFFLIKNDSEEKTLNLIKNIILIHIIVLSCRNFYSYHTNHGMFQASHTYTASTLLKYEIDGVNFQEINFNRLKEEFHFSFTKEFVHKENSPDYHLVIFKNFLQFNSNLKQLENTPKEFISDVNNFVAGSLKFLAYAIKPNGFLPIIGDTEEKQIDNLSHLSNQHNYEEFLYAQSKGTQGKPLNKIGCAFEESGYFFIKTNYPNIPCKEQFYLAAKSGFLSKYHRQDDDCHFVLSAYGEDWLIDGGLYKHEHHDPIREYMRSRYSHNLLMPKDNVSIERQTPPNKEKQKKLGLTNWLNAGSIIRAELSTDMFSSFEYKRNFNYYDCYKLNIVDTIKNISSNNTGIFQLVYHFPNDKSISIDKENNSIKIESNTSAMNLHVSVADDIDISILDKDFLPDVFIQKTSNIYNRLEDSQTILFEIKGVSKHLQELSIETNIEIKKKYDALKVFVLGSCVTRDAFELPESRQFKLVNYLARTSFASAFQNKPTYS
ncbi:TPA: heparinase II/III family protein, partial [Mannheimia haemolytica]|nr:heparinase II/III family protein [Mannheimia haemolytica]